MNTKTIITLCLSASLLLCVKTETQAAQYSKFGIVTAAKESGKWEVLKEWIDEAGYADEWLAVEYLSDDYPEFAAVTNAVVATGIATAEEASAIVSAAKDTAPDALLTAMYARDMKSPQGRSKWHGASTNWTDVAAWETVTCYEDGYIHREPARHLTPSQLVERANAALTNRLTKGVSDRLAAARLRRLAEAQRTNTVDVVVIPGAEGDMPETED